MFSRSLVNCTVFSGDDEYDSISFNDRIISLGGSPSGNKIIDMDGAAVIPGFIDSHAHLQSTAMKLIVTDLDGLTREEAKEGLANAKPNHGGWVVARGWDESLWKNTDYLYPDEIQSSYPVLAVRVDGHMGVLNRPGMREAASLGCSYEKDGVISESELERLTSKLKPDYGVKEALMKAEDYSLSKGVTTVSDITSPQFFNTYRNMEHRMRVVFNPINEMCSGYKTGDRIGENLTMGHVKLFADGSIGARTAVMSDGYRDSDASPELIYDNSKLAATYENIISSGSEVMTHAIGDVAIDQVIRTMSGYKDKRLKIEHNEFVLPLRTEIEEEGMVVSMQPNFLRWSFRGGLYEKRLGPGFIGLNNRFGSLLKNGVRVAFGSDSMPLDPVYGIKLAMNPPTSGQRVNLKQAIKCYTENSAFALHLEDETGRLLTGMSADIVALDRSDLSVRKTFFRGEEKFSV